VTLLGLLGIVVDEFFNPGLYELDLGEDLISGGCPYERCGVAVPVVDIVADLLDQDRDRAEGGASDGLAGDDASPDFYLVDPRRSDGGEIEMYVRIPPQPCTTSGVVWVDRLSMTTCIS
jgi:hypothetical protein